MKPDEALKRAKEGRVAVSPTGQQIIDALVAEVERLENRQTDYGEGFEEGMKAGVKRCAEIADENNTCEGIAQKISEAIRKEFNLEG